MKRHKLPKEILVYVCDTLEDGTPVYAVVTEVNEIPEDVSGHPIGVYCLNKSSMFVVHRELT